MNQLINQLHIIAKIRGLNAYSLVEDLTIGSFAKFLGSCHYVVRDPYERYYEANQEGTLY
jgi:hypothetical protein